ncbi:hypothetical protein [Streptomyces gilvus]|uniref:hypothetical protein n=1 Tax=Streptomyces gilvus TaxID=2920937 RepID=UPI001F0E1894|nr:hypothetical protein [Streptomyces sp. CME 23]MCH5677907.1 hypothetical protein [Streptomyces sp. CME 23]
MTGGSVSGSGCGSPTGRTVKLRLVAVYARDLAFTEFPLPRSTALGHTGSPYAELILLSGNIQSWPKEAGQTMSSRAAYLADFSPRSPQDDLAAHLIVAVVSGYALIAAANTRALAQRDRRTHRAHLSLRGRFEDRHVLHMMRSGKQVEPTRPNVMHL